MCSSGRYTPSLSDVTYYEICQREQMPDEHGHVLCTSYSLVAYPKDMKARTESSSLIVSLDVPDFSVPTSTAWL